MGVRSLVAAIFKTRTRAQVVLIVACALAYFWHFVNVSMDDVFISFRYADNLASGKGLVFNEGERVEGFSNPLWTFLLAVASFLGASNFHFGLLVVAKFLGAACSLVTLYVVFDLARQVAGRRGAWVGPALVAASAPFAFWTVAGLEGPLLVMLECIALNLHFRETSGEARRVPSSFVWLLAALTRPEPVLLFGICVVDRLWTKFQEHRTLNMRSELAYLAWFVLPYAGLLALRLDYYGQWLPNTYYAKMHLGHRIAVRGWNYVAYGADVLGWLYCVPLMLLMQVFGGRFSGRVRLLWLLLLVRLAIVIREGGDWMPALRFLAPSIPILSLLAHSALAGCLTVSARRFAGASAWPSWVVNPAWVGTFQRAINGAKARAFFRRGRSLGAALLFVALTVATVRGARAINVAWFPSGYGGIWFDCYPHFEVARIMRDELRLEGTVATGEAGVIPYYTGLRLLDLNGLMDEHLARQPGNMHLKQDFDYVFGREPDSVVLLGRLDEDGQVQSDTDHVIRMTRDPRFPARYELVLQHKEQLLVYVRREH